MPYPAATLLWHADSLQQQLQAVWPGLQVHTAAEVDSTNTRLLSHAREPGGLVPCLLVAESQTQGRGRNGRVWQSAPGASLTFSVAVPLMPADWSGLSLVVGLALADALEPLADTPDTPDTREKTNAGQSSGAAAPRLQLKWPNDLWLRDDAAHTGSAGPAFHLPAWRKLGGILIETIAVGSQRVAVVGVGLNVSPRPVAPEGEAAALSSGYACLQELDTRFTAPQALACVAPALLAALRQFEQHGFAPHRAAFARRDLLCGQTVSTTLDSVPQGVAEGVDARGVLQLRCGGVLHAVSSGEVSVRPIPIMPRPGHPTEGMS